MHPITVDQYFWGEHNHHPVHKQVAERIASAGVCSDTCFGPQKESYLKDVELGDLLTVRNLKTKNYASSTLFHLAAMYGYIEQIPKENFIEETLLVANNNKETPIFVAARYGYLDAIPREFLTGRNLLKRNLGGENVFHAAAYGGWMHAIPMQFLTMENLSKRDNKGNTPIHVAAKDSHLFESLPEHLKCGIFLDFRTRRGETPLHVLARGGCINSVAVEHLTAERLLSKCVESAVTLTKTGAFAKSEYVTVLDLIAAKKTEDHLLGCVLPTEAEYIFGHEWWAKNQNLLRQKRNVAMSEDTVDLDLF